VALDTYAGLWRRVKLHAPDVSPLLAQDWITRSFREVAERRCWSWLLKPGQFVLPVVVKDGTVTVTLNSAAVTGNAAAAAAWSTSLIGRQFRIGSSTPIYTITDVTTVVAANDTLTLDQVWGAATAAAQNYEIYQAYVTVPSDFHSFIAVIDPSQNWRLWANRWSQGDLNAWDAARTNAGSSYTLVPFAYDTTTTPPRPRYELWPHQKAAYVYPYLYEIRATDLGDSGAVLPFYIRGDVLLEGALAKAARWPGVTGAPNPYYDLVLAREHETRFQQQVAELGRQDDEVLEQDIQYYQGWNSLPWAPFPGDAAWLQKHEFAAY
jgi:hypothetical protein